MIMAEAKLEQRKRILKVFRTVELKKLAAPTYKISRAELITDIAVKWPDALIAKCLQEMLDKAR